MEVAGDLRKVQRLKIGEWIDIDFIDLKLGHIFIMFESNGEPVVDSIGDRVFTAKSDAYLNDLNIWQIDIYERDFSSN